MIARLAIIMLTLQQYCHPCFEGSDNGPKCWPGGADKVDMAGLEGSEPFIQWVTPRLPVGAPTMEIRGIQFGMDATKLKVEFVADGLGPVPIADSVSLQDKGVNSESILVANLKWPTGIVPGSTKIVVTQVDNGASKGNVTVLLVNPAFLAGGMGTLPAAANSVYLGDGPTANQRALFATTAGPALVSISYNGANGTFGTQSTDPANGMVSVAPANLGSQRPTEFVALNKFNALQSCTSSPPGYLCSGNYTTPWTMPTAVSSGSTDTMRELIAVAANENSLYRCFYDRSKAQGSREQPCVKIASYTDNAKKLWVGQLAIGNKADIIALSADGNLTLWRDDGMGTDTFSDSTKVLPQASGTPWQALVVEDIDGKNGKDVIAVGLSGVRTWLNKGDGTFAVPQTDHAQLVAARDALVGDIDGDALPDLLLLPATGDGLQALLNLSDRSYGIGRFSAPAPVQDARAASQPLMGITGSLVTVDDGSAGARRRLIVVNGTSVTAWDNKIQP